MDHLQLLNKQDQVFRLLRNSINKDRISHSYIFSGKKGTQKYESALLFCCMLMCDEKETCFECDKCKRVLNETHINVHHLRTDTATIRKQDIKDLQVEFSKTSIEKGYRIYIIHDADKFGIGAANSLLKFIEEPENKNVVGILLTENVDNIIPTIKSRCQILNFKRTSVEQLKSELFQIGFNEFEANIYSFISNDIDQIKLIKENESVTDVIEAVKTCAKVYDTNPNKLIVTFNHYINLLSDKSNLELFFTLFLAYFKDALNLKLNINQIIFIKEIETIKSFANKLSIKQLNSIIEIVIDAKSKSPFQLNYKLLYSDIAIRLSEVIHNELS